MTAPRLCGLSFLAAAAIIAGDSPVPAGVPDDAPWGPLLQEAQTAMLQGQYASAAAAYERAIPLITGSTPADRLELAFVNNGRGVACYLLGRYQEAEMFYERALATRRELLPPRDIQIAIVLNNLGDIRIAQGKYAEAHRYHSEALSIDEARLGPSSPLVANDLNNLGVDYAKQRRYAEAERALRRAIEIGGAVNPPMTRLPDYLGNLASVLALERRFDESEQIHQRVLAIQVAARGHSHPSVGLTLTRLADCASHLKRYALAVRHATEALAILRAALGDSHPHTSSAYFQLGVAYERLKRPELSQPAFERMMEIDGVAGVEPGIRCAHLREYARMLRQAGKQRDAKAVEARAAAIEASNHEVPRDNATIDVTVLGRRD